MWQFIEPIFTVTNLQLLLLVGSGILAVSLLVLALTRWGQYRPIWKCVILSFVAHILLMGYLYGTHLIFETPPVAEIPDALRVNLVDDVGSSVTETGLPENTSPEPLKPWDQFVDHGVTPSVPPLERPVIDSEIVIEQEKPDNVSVPQTGAELAEAPELPEDPFEPEQPALEDDSPSTVEMDTEPVPSVEIEVARRGEDQPEAPQVPLETPPELDRTPVENDFQPSQEPEISELAENELVSELVKAKSELPLTTELPTPSAAPQTGEFRPLKRPRESNQLKMVATPRRMGDGQPVPKIYSLRNSEKRDVTAQRRGGSLETEKAVNRALRWLAENQEPDGRWDADRWGGGRETRVFGHDRKGAGSDADSGITALATLAFLGAGHTHLEGPYQNQLRSALEFLVRQQKAHGDLAGDARLFARMYCHSMALLALGEALSMTGDHRLLQPVQRGVDFSVRAQSPTDGSWRYQPGDSGDMSQFGWQVLALKSAKLGGAQVPQQTFNRMHTFLRKCGHGSAGGLASYRPRQGPSTTMTAEALLCRYFLQTTVSPTAQREATRRIVAERPSPQRVNLYYWYYGTLALYHTGGPAWERWNSDLKKTLLGLQVRSGNDAGSWPPNGVWGSYGGRVYATSMAALNLEVYYRYLPIYEVARTGGTVDTHR